MTFSACFRSRSINCSIKHLHIKFDFLYNLKNLTHACLSSSKCFSLASKDCEVELTFIALSKHVVQKTITNKFSTVVHNSDFLSTSFPQNFAEQTNSLKIRSRKKGATKIFVHFVFEIHNTHITFRVFVGKFWCKK
ncbi:hypothetical protein BpHYR1_048011 [Brachionus plicatilis]|uniref:Uncharacterized protein n=1 Tax=Brachionus plicatilis TaxID=10195 RepID=A0A3M7T9S7_BRAPC|nr:hypothetical protein BpHYR1_048011 [Brachionus plicatilis]